MTAQHALPLEEIHAALRALTSGIMAPDLTAPMNMILRAAAQRASGHPSYQGNAERQLLVIGAGVLDLARAINARSVQPSACAPPTGDPIDVANAAHDEIGSAP